MNKVLKTLTKLIPDKLFISIKYRLKFGKSINWKNPVTYNEKLQWLKIYNRRPEYCDMVDKYSVRKYVSDKIGEEYLIPLLGVWESVEDIDFSSLPEQFVLKCTHDCGSVIICKDKSAFDIEAAKKKLAAAMKKNYYWGEREWPYKTVKPRIVAEKYMQDSVSAELRDYKLFCFNGEPRTVLVCADRFLKGGLKENFYDLDWNLMPVQRPKHSNADYDIPKPASLDLMTELARRLSENHPFVRVDFYEVDGLVYFGEITFYPNAGFEGFVPEEWDKTFGEWISLPKSKGEK